MINQQRLIQTFLDLVRIDSPSGHEAEIGRDLDARLQALGLQTEMDAVGNLVGRTLAGAKGSGDWLLLSTHMDTVGVDRGIQPVIRDGVIYSDGTTILGADDKSGVAAVLEVLTVLREQELPHPPLEVVISVGEELGLYGARQFDTSRLRSRHGIVLDAGGPTGNIVVSAPSQDNIRLTVHGVSAHAGAEPEKGINAIRVAAEAIAAMPLGRIDAETTCNVGIIEGGTARNIVPDQVKIIGEARSRDNAKLEALTASIVQAFQDAANRSGARLEADVNRTLHHLSPDRRDAHRPGRSRRGPHPGPHRASARHRRRHRRQHLHCGRRPLRGHQHRHGRGPHPQRAHRHRGHDSRHRAAVGRGEKLGT
jgi:tripeptide aminopeptidase